MSHVVTIAVKVKDLDALDAACKRLGLALNRGQTTYRWFGKFVGDYKGQDAANMHGIDPADYGKCDHAISVPGNTDAYEIGLVRQGDGYRLVFDFWGKHGRTISQPVGGNSLGLLMQAYAAEKAKLEARRAGMSVTEHLLPNGSIKVVVNSGR